MKGYLYQIYIGSEIVYIGITKDMRKRMCVHFTRKDSSVTRQIPVNEIGNITKVEYTETETYSNAIVLEAYLIAKNKPKYNTDYVEDDELTYTLNTGQIEWREYPIHNKGENPDQSLIIKDKWGKKLYEIPYLKEFYEPICKLLELKSDLADIRYCMPLVDNGYTIIRIRKNRDYWKRERECQVQRQAQGL